MTRRWSRRSLLAAVGTVASTSLAGCSDRVLGSESSPLPIKITNFTPEEQYVHVEIRRREAEELGDATVLRESYALEPSKGEGNEYTVPDVPTVPNQRYLVQARMGATQLPEKHYHYVPDCTESQGDRLYIAVVSKDHGSAVFIDQNGCR